MDDESPAVAVSRYLSEMFNRSLKELNNVFYVYLVDGKDEFAISVYEADGKLYVKNPIPGASKEYMEYIVNVIQGVVAVELVFDNNVPVLVFDSDPSILDKVYLALSRMYLRFALDRPADSLSVLGGFKLVFLDSTYSIIDAGSKTGKFFSESYCSIPGDDGWYVSYLGEDNVYMPILSWRFEGRILAYYPREDGSLGIFDVSEYLAKLSRFLELTNSIVRVEGEYEVFRKIRSIEEHVDMVDDALKGRTLPFSSIMVEHENIDEVRSLLAEVRDGLEKIKKITSLSNYIEQKLRLRIVTSIARRMVSGEIGVLSIATRKVSRLGAGYAVYISKEEAKLVNLMDRVTVKVIVSEAEKPKIIIQ